jgi:hypothetical protein
MEIKSNTMKIIAENIKKLEEIANLHVNDYDLGGAVRKLFNQNVEINRHFPNNHDLGVFIRKEIKINLAS